MFSFVECVEGERLKDHLRCALYRHGAFCKSCCFESHRKEIFFLMLRTTRLQVFLMAQASRLGVSACSNCDILFVIYL